MQRHGGELKIESELGKGSKFTLIFPASRVLQAKPSQVEEAEVAV
jgi:two-component system phosphate regulon sensor histidine kinase PhoR